MIVSNQTLSSASSPDNPVDTLDFESLLDQYDYELPKRGQMLAGQIVAVVDGDFVADVGLKRDAFVLHADLDRLSESARSTLEPGSFVNLVVVRPFDREGKLIVSISKALERMDWERAEHMLDSGDTFEAAVTDFNKGGLVVEFGRLRGFVPQSQIDAIPRGLSGQALEERKAEMVSQSLCLQVLEVDVIRNRLILSEKSARQAARRQRLRELPVGEVLTGRVVNLTDFGAFVDLGGVDGLVHVSRLARSYVRHPSEVVALGEEVTVRVDAVDLERGRVSLNRADLLPDPWDELPYEVDQLVVGRIRNAADFGLFVTLNNEIDGLVHTSEMVHRAPHVGQEVLVRIIGVNHEKKRISLSIDQVTEEEWDTWLREQGQPSPGQA